MAYATDGPAMPGTARRVIRRLEPSVVNKIAAGEVIERPASVVKELVENALDAGATRIDVSLEQGGVELIRVTDNGCGIPADQLALAIESHATSKITSADDLFRVSTLGFRGEALPSIASVSRFLLRSRTPDEPGGAELEVVGGNVGQVVPCGCPVGTTVEVRNLFYNTPVRRKFLKTTATEMGHTSETLIRLALAHPHVHFTLRHNQREVHDLPPVSDWRQRIEALFGRELADQLLWVESDQPARLCGYVGSPSLSRPNNRMQYLFLNGRYIRDRALGHALVEAYRGLLLQGRQPVCFLSLEVAPDEVDVNVHPTKLEVRFSDGGRLYSQLLGTLRTRFLSTDLTSQWQPRADLPGASTRIGDPQTAAFDPNKAAEVRADFVAWAKGQLGNSPGVSSASSPASSAVGSSDDAGPLQLHTVTRQSELYMPWDGSPEPAALADEEELPDDADDAAADTESFAPPAGIEATSDLPAASGTSEYRPSLPAYSRRLPAVQMHNRYLVVESEEGMLVIDQHALHERILYEQLKEKVLKGSLEKQQLLVPEPVDLSPAEKAAVLEQREVLSKLGIDVEPFGGDTVLVSSYPAMLRNARPAEVLMGVLEALTSGRPLAARDIVDELLHMMSCKAAVKAGDPLTPEEIDALLEQRHLATDAHHCPHGRPTALVLTKAELDRQFMRK